MDRVATVIFHNPDCGTSRNVLRAILATGTTPIIVEYLTAGWTRPQLQALFAVAGMTARDALRVSNTPAEEMGLTDPAVTDDALLDAMIAHPILVNRPIVCTPNGIALCRPSEAVLRVLENAPSGPLLKEDGTPLFG